MTPQEMVERALAATSADDCVVIADESSTANLRWANNTLTTNGVARSRQLTVVAIMRRAEGASVGVVSRAGVRPEHLGDVVRAAEEASRGAPPAEDARPLVDASAAPPADQAGDWDAEPGETGIGVFEGFAPSLGAAFDAAAGSDRALFGFAQHSLTSSYIGTSRGLRLRHDQPSGKVEINAKSADLARSAWAGAGTRDFKDVDVAELDAELARRLAWAERRVDLPAGRYETLLPPSAVADLMTYMYWSAGARDAHDGHSAFSRPGGGTRVGEVLSDVPVTLRSDPHEPGMECAPFVIAHASGRDSSVFDNGLQLRATDWIRKGTLAALHQTRYAAELTGLPVTPEIDNLILEAPGDRPSLDEMIAGTERGLLLTCLWYIREVDPQSLLLTGLTRDGVYLVENGEVVGAANNFRFNESPLALLRRIADVGVTQPTLPREWSDYFTRAAMPPLRIPDFNMSTVSKGV